MAMRRDPPALVVRWEELHPGLQVAIVAPLAILVMWAAHVWFMGQPVVRGLSYGVFWGAILTGIVIAATRSERARRRAGR
jgi:hypothetical protein